MHMEFRVLGQQMGLQLVRGILPESIDVYLNAAIIDRVKAELQTTVLLDSKNDSNLNPSALTAINAFRTLYSNKIYLIDKSIVNEVTEKVAHYNAGNGFYIINLPIKDSGVRLDENESEIDPMMIIGFNVGYTGELGEIPTKCRLIANDILDVTLTDYCNRATKKYPICALDYDIVPFDEDKTKGAERLSIYTETPDCDIKSLAVNYIKYPNKVLYSEEEGQSVDCDLPEYMQHDIVQAAVQKYFISIAATSSSNNKND